MNTKGRIEGKGRSFLRNRIVGLILVLMLASGFGVAQTLDNADWQDADGDGNIDQVLLTFSGNVDVADPNGSADGLDCILINDVGPVSIDNFNYTVTNATNVLVTFPGDPISGTAIAGLSVTYALGQTSTIIINGGTEIGTGASAAYTDGAAPVISEFKYEDNNGDGAIDQFVVSFSEALNAASNLEANDLSLSNKGDFTSAAFGGATTNLLGAGGETSVTVGLGTPASVQDTQNGGTLEVTTQNTFSLSDGTNVNNTLAVQNQATFTDGAAPSITEFKYEDNNGDGAIDQFVVSFSEALNAASNLEANDLSLSNKGDFTLAAFGGSTTNLLGAGGETSVTVGLGTPASVQDTQNGGTLEVTTQNTFSLSDGTNVNNTLAVQSQVSFTDGASPVITEFKYEDNNGDGAIDQFVVSFSEALNAASNLEANDLSLSNKGDFTLAAFGGSTTNLLGAGGETSVTVGLGTPASVQDTQNGGTLEVTTQNTFSLSDGTNVNNTLAVQSQVSFTDGASPVITEFKYEDNNGDGKIDQFVVTYSEQLDATSVLRANDLLFTNVGDFTGALFGGATTDLIIGAVTTTIVPLGTPATPVDTKEDLGTIAISSQNAFSLTDGTNVNSATVAQSQASFSDGAGPIIISLTYTDATHLKVTFSEDVDQSTAQTIGNYALDNSISVQPAGALRNTGNNNEVDLTVNDMTSILDGRTLTITINLVQDLNTNPIATNSMAGVVLADAPPTIVSLTYISPTSLKVTFSEDVEQTTAQTIGNYVLDNGIIIQTGGAIRNAVNNNEVDLTVNDMTSLLDGTITLNILISNVQDLNTNTIVPNSPASTPLPDLTKPTIISLDFVNATTMEVTFSEDVDQITAETTTNYVFDQTIGNPLGAARQGDNSKVRLTVPNLTNAGLTTGSITLMVTVSNVEDLNSNVILALSTANKLLPDLIGPQVISSFIDPISGEDDKAWVVMEFDEVPFTTSGGTGDLVLLDFEVVLITADGQSNSYKIDDKVWAAPTSTGTWIETPFLGTEKFYRVRVHENQHDAYTNATQIDVRINNNQIYDAAGNVAPSGLGSGTGTISFSDTNGPTIKITSDVDANNTYVDIEFSEDAYGPGSAALTTGEFFILFTQNAGNATGIASLDDLESSGNGSAYSSPATAGHRFYKLYFTLTNGPASGVEEITVQPNGDAAWFDFALKNTVQSEIIVPVITLNDKLPPTLSSITLATTNPFVTKARVIDDVSLTFTASETLQSDPVVTFSSGGNGVTGSVTINNASAPTYTATYTVGTDVQDTDGTVTFTIDFTDTNTNPGITVTTPDAGTVTIDNNKPDIFDVTFSTDPIYEGALIQTVSVIFNEDMDPNVSLYPIINLSGSNGGTQTNVGWLLDKRTFQATFTHNPTEEEITETVTVDAGDSKDDAGNTNNASAGLYTFEVDTKKPQTTVSIDDPDGFVFDGQSVVITSIFDEILTTAPEIVVIATVNGGTFTMVGTAPTATWTHSYTAGATEETVTYTFQTGTDAAGNEVDAAPLGTTSFDIDNTDPFMTLLSPLHDTHNIPLGSVYTITLNEIVVGSGSSDIFLKKFDGTIIGTFNSTDVFGTNTVTEDNLGTIDLTTITLTEVILESTEYYIQINAGAAIDRAGNPFSGFTDNTFWFVTTFGAPTITVPAVFACIGDNLTISGKYFTGVDEIRFGGPTGDLVSAPDFTIDNDEQISVAVPAQSLTGTIYMKKNNGQTYPAGTPANSGDATSESSSIVIGPRAATLTQFDGFSIQDICNSGVSGITTTTIKVDISGGAVGNYTVIVSDGNTDYLIGNYTSGSVITIPITTVADLDTGPNPFTIVSVQDANGCFVVGSKDMTGGTYQGYGTPDGNYPDALTGSYVVTLWEQSIVDAGPDQSVCVVVASTITLAGNITGSVTAGTWTTNGAGSFNNDGIDGAVYTIELSDITLGQLTFTYTSDLPGVPNPCAAAEDDMVVTFTTSTTADAGPDREICLSDPFVDLVGSIGGGATAGIWTTESGALTPGSFDNDLSFTPRYTMSAEEIGMTSITLRFTSTDAVCGGNLFDEMTLAIGANPVITINSGPIDLCYDTKNVQYSVNGPNTNTYAWTLPPNASITAGDGSNTVIVDWNNTDPSTGLSTISVVEQGDGAGCFTAPLLFDVMVNPLPTVRFEPSVTNFSKDAPQARLTDLVPDLINPLTGAVGPDPDNLTTFGVFSGPGVLKDGAENYFFDPGQAGVAASPHPIVYTYTDVNGCVNSTTPLDFTVFDASEAVVLFGTVIPIPDEFCADAAPVDIELSGPFLVAQLGTNFDFSRFSGPGIADLGNQQSATLTPSAPFELTLGGVIEIEYFRKHKVTGVEESFGTQIVVINPVPVPSPNPIAANYCSHDDAIPLTRNFVLNPTTAPGSFFNFTIEGGDPDGLITNPDPEVFLFNPGNAVFDSTDFEARTVTVRYYYIDGNGCDDEAFFDVNVFQRPPKPLEEDIVQCAEDDNILLEITDPVPGATVIWYATEADVGTPNFLDQGPTFLAPLSSNLVDFYVTQKINNCESLPSQIRVGRIANPSFIYEGICEGSPTEFEITSSLEDIDSVVWSFLEWDGTLISQIIEKVDSVTSISLKQQYTFPTSGRKKTNLEFFSGVGCNALVTVNLFILPSVTVTDKYSEEFEGNNGWIAWGSDSPNSSWENAVPAGTRITGDSKAWVTNATGIFPANEESFVYSPCFDISALQRPMISIYTNTDVSSSDGIALQYSSDGRFGTWKTVGSDITGIDWYDARALNNNPGGSSTNIFAYGWSAEQSGWRNSRHPLNEIPEAERGSLIFRISFNSGSNSKFEGFAFDKFVISERERVVVLEHFESKSEDSQTQQDDIDEFNADSDDMITIQYRTNLDGEDPLFTSEVNTRLEYYGFTASPKAIFDGSETREETFDTWAETVFSERSLIQPTAEISITSDLSVEGLLRVTTKVSAMEDLPSPFVVQVAVVEMDANGIKNVIRKFLPDAGGTKFEQLLKADDPVEFTNDWKTSSLKLEDLDLAVVVFIQDEGDEGKGEIFQSSYDPITSPSTITGILDLENGEKYKLYPNPASEMITIEFNYQDVTSLKVFDHFGKLIAMEKLQPDVNFHQVKTAGFAIGVYFVQIETKNKEVDRLKFVVTH